MHAMAKHRARIDGSFAVARLLMKQAPRRVRGARDFDLFDLSAASTPAIWMRTWPSRTRSRPSHFIQGADDVPTTAGSGRPIAASAACLVVQEMPLMGDVPQSITRRRRPTWKH